MTTFTVTLGQNTKTTYILRPSDFRLVCSTRFAGSNSGQMQYEFEVAPANVAPFRNALGADHRIAGWNERPEQMLLARPDER